MYSKHKIMIKQLDIYKVNTSSSDKIETQKLFVVLQSDGSNKLGRNTVVAPIYSGEQGWPGGINIQPDKENNLERKSHIDLREIQVMNIQKLEIKIGQLDNSLLKKIKEALRVIQTIFDY